MLLQEKFLHLLQPVHTVLLSLCNSTKMCSKDEDGTGISVLEGFLKSCQLGVGRGQRLLNLTKKRGSLKGPP